MHIVNIMFSCVPGGIEQAFVDYCEGLKKRGHRVTAITHPDAVINPELHLIGITPITMRNFSEWDPVAVLRLERRLQKLAPDAVIAHANRAYGLTRWVRREWPLIGIAQNYNGRTRRLRNADGAFATTHDLMHFLTRLKVPEERIFHIPNMVRVSELPHRGAPNTPPMIGTMGRFVKKKGFDIYIEALKILKERGYNFKAILGGAGAEEARLVKLAKAAGLKDVLALPGWIEDKKAFYTRLDMFCLPSLDEPFGIVLLEAFIYGTPVIATDTEGPKDIVTPNFDALIVGKGSATELANAIARLLDDPQFAASLATNAFVKAKTTYSIESVAERIEKALGEIIKRWNS